VIRLGHILPASALLFLLLIGCQIAYRPSAEGTDGAALSVEASTTPPKTHKGDSFVGPEACRQCHEMQYSSWVGSPHSRSFEVLKQVERQDDPTCLRCHVTGFFVQSGFVDETTTPQHASVTCEACHGPGAGHVKAALKGESLPDYGEVGCPDCQYARICILCHRESDFDAAEMVKRLNCRGEATED